MKIISPSFEIMSLVDGKAVLNHIEKCGRVCYKSEDKITETSAAAFVAGIIKRGHEAVLEHFNITVIRPVFLAEGTPGWDIWRDACRCAEDAYFDMLTFGCSPQEARSVLPNSLKTEVVMTANLREWRHFFKLRTAPAAHPQMREVAIPLLRRMQELIPVVFDDLEVPNEKS